MGDVISLAAHRRARTQQSHPTAARGRVTFYFDLASPETYLAAERVDRLFASVVWCPAIGETILRGAGPDTDAAVAAERARVEDRAAALRLPLVWPDVHPGGSHAAMRVAGLAAERGQGARFVLAASRLTFCGGYELADPEVIAEAAAAAYLDFDDCLQAAGDTSRDAEMERTGKLLLSQGAERLPALRVGRSLYSGESRVGEAAAAWRAEPARLARTAPFA